RQEIIARWSERIYRSFRLYLWGGSRAFHHDYIQAYSVVAQRSSSPGPRPGAARRLVNEVKGWI
ncbi:MAG TPA: hypothetical protein VIM36_04125, partial [Gemmatimonadaceae bacterium]